MPQTLDYQREDFTEVEVEEIGDSFSIRVPYDGDWPICGTKRFYTAAAHTELLGIVFFPIVGILHVSEWVLKSTLLRRSRPVLLWVGIDSDKVEIDALQCESGAIQRHRFDRRNVGELRRGKVEDRLVIRIPGEWIGEVSLDVPEIYWADLSAAIERAMAATQPKAGAR